MKSLEFFRAEALKWSQKTKVSRVYGHTSKSRYKRSHVVQNKSAYYRIKNVILEFNGSKIIVFVLDN